MTLESGEVALVDHRMHHNRDTGCGYYDLRNEAKAKETVVKMNVLHAQGQAVAGKRVGDLRVAKTLREVGVFSLHLKFLITTSIPSGDGFGDGREERQKPESRDGRAAGQTRTSRRPKPSR
jgi:hypothetical protein